MPPDSTDQPAPPARALPGRAAVAFRLLAVVGLGASALSLADAVADAPAFCGFDGGCDRVTDSAYGRPLGVPLPVVGVVGFAAVLGLALVGCERTARILAIVGGVAGLGLIVVQLAVIGHVCPLCLVADGCGIGLGALALVRPVGVEGVSWLARGGWLAAAAGVVFLPLAAVLVDIDPPPPPQVTAHWVEGRVTVVEVTDFDCDHCRRADELLRPRLRDRADIHFVRLPAPMPKHAHARPAARAFLAAQAQGKGEEMAAALFAAEDRSAEECRQIAARLGLDLAAYDKVVADPATDAALDATVAWAKTAGPGLPLVWVQGRLLSGSPKSAALDAAFRRARPFGR